MKKHYEITVRTNPRFRPERFALFSASQFALIGVGVLVDSPAMQWSGFVVFALMHLALAAAMRNRNKDMTLEEASWFLQRLEAEEEGATRGRD